MQLNTVVLPAPFGPIKAVMSPRPAVNDRSLTARRPPKRMVRWSTRNNGDERAGAGRACAPVRAASYATAFIRLPLVAARQLPSIFHSDAAKAPDADRRAGKSTVRGSRSGRAAARS